MPETPERCTCGTLLVENARFCHRCGRAVYELTPEETVDTEPLVPAITVNIAPPPPPPPLRIGFGNPIALRVALFMSLGVTTLTMLLAVFFPVWCLIAGWMSIRLYQRLTGLQLNAPAGARLGFLMGVFTFIGLAVVIALALATPGVRESVIDQMVKQDPRTSEILNNPGMLGIGLLTVMPIFFMLVAGICAAGGAIGAKLHQPDRRV